MHYPSHLTNVVKSFWIITECKADMGAYKSCGHETCIYKEYFDDEIVNCPFIDCLDESACPNLELGKYNLLFKLD